MKRYTTTRRTWLLLTAALLLVTFSIGDFEIAQAQSVGDIIISEIMYNAASAEDDWEWVEIYNTTGSAIDISGWVIDDGNSVFHSVANIASGSVPAMGSAILYNADDTSATDFEAAWGTGINLVATTNWGAMGLNNGGDTIGIWASFADYDGDQNTYANVINTVVYDDDGVIWPADDGASSIYLTNLTADNNVGTNWAISTDGGTTPLGDGYTSSAGGGNSGADVGSPGGTLAGGGTTIVAPYTEDFSGGDLGDLMAFSVDADTANTWANGGFGDVEANGFGDTAPADDWLITPLIDISGLTNPIASFNTETRFTDGGLAYPQLSFLYSTNYPGTGDPSGSTWIPLSFTPSAEDSDQVTGSGNIDLSALPDNLYFAWRYQSSGTGPSTSSRWRVDDIEIIEEPTGGTGDEFGVCADGNETLISAIQSTGGDSPDVATVRTVEGIITAVFQGTDQVGGYFVQEEDADADGNALTSEGIFIFDGANTPSVGDLVRLRGTVSEFFDNTQIDTVTDFTTCSSGNGLPTTTTINLPLTNGQDDYEAFEGMLVNFPQELTVGDVFDHPRFNRADLVQGGVVRSFTQDNTPDATNFAAYPDEVARRIISIDDASDRLIDPEEPLTFPFQTNAPYDSSNPLGSHSTVTGVTGAIFYIRGEYRIFPTQSFTINEVDVPETTPDVGGNVTVASFNIENWFNETGTGGNFGPQGRGAENAAEFQRQTDKILAAMQLVDADIFGISEMENEDDGPDSAPAALVNALNGVYGAGTFDYVQSGTNGTDAIKTAIVYKTAVVTPIGDPAVNDTNAFVDPNNSGSQRNRPALAQTFQVSDPNNADFGAVFTVVVVHLKSKGESGVSPCPANPDCAQGEGEGNWNSTRAEAATELANWLGTDPTGSGDDDFIVVGDFNAYAQEDPIVNFIAAGFTSLTPSTSYSYQFFAEFGTLDYGFANATMNAQVTGSEELHINSNFSDRYTWNDPDFYTANEFRSSDHDPLLVGLDLVVEEDDLLLVENLRDADGNIVTTEIEDESLLQVQVEFSDDVDDPTGDTDDDDVTNPSNYILIYGGANAVTTALPNDICASTLTLDGDDTEIAIVSVTYDDNTDAGPYLATISFASALAEGDYVLIICASTSVVQAESTTPINAGVDVTIPFTVVFPTDDGGDGDSDDGGDGGTSVVGGTGTIATDGTISGGTVVEGGIDLDGDGIADVTQLPVTGETPWWRSALMLSLAGVVAVLAAFGFVWRKRRTS